MTPAPMRRIKLGCCAMPSKLKSVPMRTLLDTLVKVGNFELVEFTENQILYEDVGDWPRVDCLIAFYSRGYPIEKVIEYARKVQPIVLNELESQFTLRNRCRVYQLLKDNGIPTASYIVVDHKKVAAGKAELEEHEDYIVYNGVRMNKPFIEKPEDADDHNNYVYYPVNAGGGCKKLFRKLANRSSDYYPDISNIRRDGVYIYEEFLPTLGTDIKVYTVGPMYAHAEARKSPTLDGRVQRTENGKEERYPVLLGSEEKWIAFNIVSVFKQVVCGFDILRTTSGKAVVCDVNGWSFVKGNPKYYDDCAQILSTMFGHALRHRGRWAPSQRIVSQSISGWARNHSLFGLRASSYRSCILDELTKEDLQVTVSNVDSNRSLMEHSLHSSSNNLDSSLENDPGVDDELQTIVVVMRHGDRSPKQKTKFLTSDPAIINLFKARLRPIPYRRTCVVKLRTKQDLVEFGHVIQDILESNQPHDHPNYDDLSQINSLFADEDDIDLTRKVQLVLPKDITLGDDGPDEILVVVKWGGELTSHGLKSSEVLGHDLREKLYPGDKDGLLRLHATFRHDFKIYTSDEGRCQMTAASFTKGILDLDGGLAPILVQMVSREEKAQEIFEESQYTTTTKKCKAFIQAIIQTDLAPKELCQQYFQPSFMGVDCPICCPDKAILENPFVDDDSAEGGYGLGCDCDSGSTTSFTPIQIGSVIPTTTTTAKACAPLLSSSDDIVPLEPSTIWVWQSLLAQYHGALEVIGPMKTRLETIDHSISKLLEKIDICLEDMALREADLSDEGRSTRKKLQGIHRRWALLSQAWKRNNVFDATKIPEVYDNAQFDNLHGLTYLHYAGAERCLRDIFENAGRIGPLVSSLEFGINPNEKVEIGCKSVPRLLRKINDDLMYQHARVNDETASNPTASTAECGVLFQRQSSRETKAIGRHSPPEIPPSFGAQPSTQKPPSPALDDDDVLINHFGKEEGGTPSGTSPVPPLGRVASQCVETPRHSDLHTEDEDGEHVILKHEEARRMGIKSPWRKVRSRYYTASASHVMSILNVLTYGQFVTWYLGGPLNGHQRDCSDVSAVTVLTQSDGCPPFSPLSSSVAPLHISASDTPYLSRVTMRVLRPPGRTGQVPLNELRVDLSWTPRFSEPNHHESGLSPHRPLSNDQNNSVNCTVGDLCQLIRNSLNRLTGDGSSRVPTIVKQQAPVMNLEESA